jgi:hypothetical protein
MKNFFLKWILFSLGFILTLIIYLVWYWERKILSIQKYWDVIDETKWNDLVNNVNSLSWAFIPSWFIWAFNLSSCPLGWLAADWTKWTPDLRGEFIRWLDNWRGIDTWRALASWQTDSFKNHYHNFTRPQWRLWEWTIPGSTTIYWTTSNMIFPSLWNTESTWWTETRPRNIAFLYCIKQ